MDRAESGDGALTRFPGLAITPAGPDKSRHPQQQFRSLSIPTARRSRGERRRARLRDDESGDQLWAAERGKEKFLGTGMWEAGRRWWRIWLRERLEVAAAAADLDEPASGLAHGIFLFFFWNSLMGFERRKSSRERERAAGADKSRHRH